MDNQGGPFRRKGEIMNTLQFAMLLCPVTPILCLVRLGGTGGEKGNGRGSKLLRRQLEVKEGSRPGEAYVEKWALIRLKKL